MSDDLYDTDDLLTEKQALEEANDALRHQIAVLCSAGEDVINAYDDRWDSFSKAITALAEVIKEARLA